jgi:phosphopantothenoylcysteine decarboxylase/phosphopantothenate--cysteine ligase
MPKSKEVILGVTGSIAAYKACEIINRLREHHANITVVMTKEAKEFIAPLSLQALSGNKVICDLFELAPLDNRYLRGFTENVCPKHISLAQKADVVLIAPATAHIVAKLACGLADDVLTCLALSTRAPIVICCAMNENMLKHKITQENIARLKKLGYRFIGPEKGHLVCGDRGIGHLASVETIVQEVMRLLR